MEQLNRAMQALQDPEVRRKFEQEVLEDYADRRPTIDQTTHEKIYRYGLTSKKRTGPRKRDVDPDRASLLADQRAANRQDMLRGRRSPARA